MTLSPAISIYPTRDPALINAIMRSPDVFDGSTDDSVQDPMSIDITVLIDRWVFLCVEMASEVVGVIVAIVKDLGVVYEVHTLLTAKCRGKNAIRAGREVAKWFFTNTPCQRLESYCFSDCPAAKFFARAVGFTMGESTPNPSTRHGKPVDLIHCFLAKPINI